MPDGGGGEAEEVARQALILRAFALQVLARRPVPAGLAALVASCSQRAWEVVLEAEACALPLARALRDHPARAALAGPALGALARREAVEVQRVLVARWELGQLDRVAAEGGIELCVIKGGALALSDATALDLGDLDVLVASADMERAVALLAALGLHREQAVAIFEVPVPVKIGLAGEGLLDVELHAQLLYGAARRPLPVARRPAAPLRALQRWTGGLAAAAVLVHSSEHHPHRCGHLRDVLLLVELLAGLSAEDRALLDREVAASLAEGAIREMLALADAIGAGHPPADSARLQLVAARKYLEFQLDPADRTGRYLGSRGVASYLPYVTEGALDAVRLIPRRSHARIPRWRVAPGLSRRVIAGATRGAHLAVDLAALVRAMVKRGQAEAVVARAGAVVRLT